MYLGKVRATGDGAISVKGAAMKLLVLGASGKTGSEVVKQALDAGHEVTAFVRDRAKLSITDAGLRVSTGDAMSFDDLRPALQGQDAVISTLGASKSSEKLIASSTEALIKAMHETGVRRVVMMSSFSRRRVTSRAACQSCSASLRKGWSPTNRRVRRDSDSPTSIGRSSMPPR